MDEKKETKVGLTGHSNGIGKAFTELLDHKGIEWVGFDLTNGYNIETEEGQRSIVKGIEDCNVFFNNAYSWNGYGHCQTELLYKVWRQWRTKNKRIVCMSSIGGDIHKEVDEIEPWEEGKGYLGYDSHKAGLDHACKQLNTLPYWKLGYHCKIINVRPGYVDTQLALDSHPTLDPNSNTLKGVQHASNFTIKKIDPNRIAEIVLWTIQHQEHIMSITIADRQVANSK